MENFSLISCNLINWFTVLKVTGIYPNLSPFQIEDYSTSWLTSPLHILGSFQLLCSSRVTRTVNQNWNRYTVTYLNFFKLNNGLIPIWLHVATFQEKKSAPKFKGIFGVSWLKWEHVYVKRGKISHLVSGGPPRSAISASPESEMEHKARSTSWTCNPRCKTSWTEGENTDDFKYDSKSKIIRQRLTSGCWFSNTWASPCSLFKRELQTYIFIISSLRKYLKVLLVS